jgi:hypothetical protein
MTTASFARGLAMAALALLLAGCNQQGAVPAIEAYGFRDVRLTGPAMFGCSEDDNIAYNTSFTAIAPGGKPVRGVACAGLLKG